MVIKAGNRLVHFGKIADIRTVYQSVQTRGNSHTRIHVISGDGTSSAALHKCSLCAVAPTVNCFLQSNSRSAANAPRLKSLASGDVPFYRRKCVPPQRAVRKSTL